MGTGSGRKEGGGSGRKEGEGAGWKKGRKGIEVRKGGGRTEIEGRWWDGRKEEMGQTVYFNKMKGNLFKDKHYYINLRKNYWLSITKNIT